MVAGWHELIGWLAHRRYRKVMRRAGFNLDGITDKAIDEALLAYRAQLYNDTGYDSDDKKYVLGLIVEMARKNS